MVCAIGAALLMISYPLTAKRHAQIRVALDKSGGVTSNDRQAVLTAVPLED